MLLAACLGLGLVRQKVALMGGTVPTSNTGAGARLLVTTNDLSWVGEAQVPQPSTGGSTIQGTTKVAETAMAVRIVTPTDSNCADQRRFIIPNFSNYGQFGVGNGGISSISATNPAVVKTVNAHGLSSGYTLNLWGTNSSPSADGVYKITVTDSTHFSIPLNLSGQTAGTAAGWATVLPNQWGDFVEYCLPAASSWYTGTDATLSPTLHETRRWPGTAVTAAMGVQGDQGNGDILGGMWWDDANNVLWMNIYGYYDTNNMPSLVAAQLLDTADSTLGSDYKQVGTTYGPWFYRSNVAGSAHVEWKGINHGFLQIPSDQQVALGNRTTGVIGTVGAVGGTGHIGLGLRAINLPALSLAANSVMFPTDNFGVGLKLADYTSEFSPNTPAWGRRENGYTVVQYTSHMSADTGLYDLTTGALPGYWQMSMDQSSGAVWVETSDREGIVSFGRQVTGNTAYGFTPISNTFKDITDISESGTTVTAHVRNHKLSTGDTAHIGCVAPSGYTGNYTVTVTDGDHFTYTSASSGMAAGSYTNSGTVTTLNGHVFSCTTDLGGMEAFGWNTSNTPDITDPGRDNPSYSNGYAGQTFDIVLRLLDPSVVRGVAAGASPYNDNINWKVLHSLYNSPPTGWHIPPVWQSPANGSSSRLDQLSASANAAYWDSTTNQIVWMKIQSAGNAFVSSGTFTPTIQIFHVN